jgi:hypothetical protein
LLVTTVDERDEPRDYRWLFGVFGVFVLLVVVPVWRAAGQYCFHLFDLGIYSQALALIRPGDINPWLSGRQVAIFADHFDPILLLVAPLARWLPPWRAALLIEAGFVAAALLPVAWLYKNRVIDQRLALVAAVLLLFNSATTSAMQFPAHPTTWAIFPAVLLMAALVLERPVVLLVALNLLCACREEFPFIGLVLSGVLLLRRKPTLAALTLACSAAWLVAAFWLRPQLVGPTQAYAASLFSGLGDDPLRYVKSRFANASAWSRLGSVTLPFLPAAVWAWRSRLRPSWGLLALLAPPLAVRFLGVAWRHHYLPPVIGLAVGILLAMMSRQGRSLPGWVVAATILLTAAPAERVAQFAVRAAGVQWGRPLAQCPAKGERLAKLDDAVSFLATHVEGAALVEGNLFAPLATRPDLFAVAGPQDAPTAGYRYVLVEKGESGDVWPTSRARLAELVGIWRGQATRLLEDDDTIFFAEGPFVADR